MIFSSIAIALGSIVEVSGFGFIRLSALGQSVRPDSAESVGHRRMWGRASRSFQSLPVRRDNAYRMDVQPADPRLRTRAQTGSRMPKFTK